MENDDDAVRRMLGMKLIEAARKAGADLDAPKRPTPPPADEEADDSSDFFSC
ncbi:hypothetical protein [Noviherbaspirillum aridicola]|uniref:DNA-binding protein H-NS n=1 Tax=Noviherbaspirillum aridicola TaxID=2849687 RepID=A0ABQ4PYW8_9BURK|nr:hypothetical protein [Noviherbaspirillum aridicola]GIZ50054.1 hypothetical protein NCCP691_00680 [Noviherbaspirillum aridicola]